jgi:Uma2 family endonuclease
MSIITTPETAAAVVYPESDGRPMADNTRQFRWIVTIQGGLDALFRDRQDVFVAGDLLWYPVEGRPDIRVAPDALVVFGRPKGDRGSYLQWREDGIAPQVVFEVLSPGNTVSEMVRKLRFYERHGVDEYYVYDPDRGELQGWRRTEATLEEITTIIGWVSPQLGIRFDMEGADLVVTRPDGRRFASYVELEAAREAAEAATSQERQRADDAEARAAALAARLRELGVDPDA